MVFFLSECHAKLLCAYAECVGRRDWHKDGHVPVKKKSKGMAKNKNMAPSIKWN